MWLVVCVTFAVPLDLGATHESTSSTTILVAVITSPNHERARGAIRDTWGAEAKASPISLDVRFFVGRPEDQSLESNIRSEHNRFGDVVRLAVTEKYENLGAKTLETIAWAHDHGYHRVLKVDDDTFLNVKELVKFLDQHRPSSNLYAGVFKEQGDVISNPNSRWYMRDQYPHDKFPPYAFGPCYFLGRDIIRHIATHRDSLIVYRVEDAGVALWMESLPVTKVQMQAFLQLAHCVDAPVQPVFVSPVNAQEMLVVQNNIRNGDVCGSDRWNHPYELEVCRSNTCACWPSVGDCEAYWNGEYVDIVPRV